MTVTELWFKLSPPLVCLLSKYSLVGHFMMKSQARVPLVPALLMTNAAKDGFTMDQVHWLFGSLISEVERFVCPISTNTSDLFTIM